MSKRSGQTQAFTRHVRNTSHVSCVMWNKTFERHGFWIFFLVEKQEVGFEFANFVPINIFRSAHDRNISNLRFWMNAESSSANHINTLFDESFRPRGNH